MGRASTAHFPAGDTGWNDLTFSEQFLLWSMRMWVRLATDPQRAQDFLSPAFARVGATEAGLPFHRFMCTLTAGATRTIDVQCPRRMMLSGDEELLLRCFALAQNGQTGMARGLMRHYATPSAVRFLVDHASELMGACTAGGVTIRPFPDDPAGNPFLMAERSGHAGAIFIGGNATVH